MADKILDEGVPASASALADQPAQPAVSAEGIAAAVKDGVSSALADQPAQPVLHPDSIIGAIKEAVREVAYAFGRTVHAGASNRGPAVAVLDLPYPKGGATYRVMHAVIGSENTPGPWYKGDLVTENEFGPHLDHLLAKKAIEPMVELKSGGYVPAPKPETIVKAPSGKVADADAPAHSEIIAGEQPFVEQPGEALSLRSR